VSVSPFRHRVLFEFTLSRSCSPLTRSCFCSHIHSGGRESLSSKLLRIKISGESDSLLFNITSGPNHGGLEKEREYIRSLSSSSSSTFYPVDRFSSLDLDKGRLSYRHDGSETPRDRLELVAYNSALNFMFACALDIIVKGVNNHPPKKSPTASLSVNVVLNGRRILSPEILDYVDEDWDAERKALKYSTKGNPSGGAGGRNGIGNIYDSTKAPARSIFQWTQADIDDGKLVFKHEGSETQGFLHFWVTDGKFIVNGKRFYSYLSVPSGLLFLCMCHSSLEKFATSWTHGKNESQKHSRDK